MTTPPVRASAARVGCTIIIAVFVLFVLVVMPEPVTLVPWTILSGWIVVIGDVIPRMTWNWEMVTTGMVCLVVFIIGFHWFAGWLRGHHTTGARWPWRWTFSVTAGVVLMFVAGIAVIGLVHQSIWLAKTDEPMVRYDMLRYPDMITTHIEMEARSNENDQGEIPPLTGDQVRKRLPEILSYTRSPEVRVTVLSGPRDLFTALVVDLRRTAIGRRYGICYYRWNSKGLEQVFPTEAQVGEFIADAQAGRSLADFSSQQAP